MAPHRRSHAYLAAVLALGACSGGGDDQPADHDGGGPDATVGGPDAAVDAPSPDAGPVWATYRIEVGRHDATITGGGEGNPIRAFTQVDGRDFLFAFDSSAAYTLTMPTQPEDQFDWNKLPGLSDCGTVDLSVNGTMFGWRWRLDTNPRVLEVTAYANNNSTHLTPPQPLFTLDAAELAAEAPLRYRTWFDGNVYRFTVKGTVGGRTIDVATTLPRTCPGAMANAFKWASGLYFGGTSTAPSVVTGKVSETTFAP